MRVANLNIIYKEVEKKGRRNALRSAGENRY